MAQELQKKLKEVCESADDMRFHANYSGRGMHGQSCIGISGSKKQCMLVIAEVIKNMAFDVASAEVEEDTRMDMNNDFDNAVDTLLTCMEMDSMGYDQIFYWSELEPIEKEDDAG